MSIIEPGNFQKSEINAGFWQNHCKSQSCDSGPLQMAVNGSWLGWERGAMSEHLIQVINPFLTLLQTSNSC